MIDKVSNNAKVKLPFSLDELDADKMKPRQKHYRNKAQILGRERRAKLDKLFKGGKMFRSGV